MPDISASRLEVLSIVRSVANRAVEAVLDFVIRAVPLVGPAVPRAFAGDAQVKEHLWKISPEACPPTKPDATRVEHDEKLRPASPRIQRISGSGRHPDLPPRWRGTLSPPGCSATGAME